MKYYIPTCILFILLIFTSYAQNPIFDNFRPYIEKVIVKKDNTNGQFIYEGEWNFNGTSLAYSNPTNISPMAGDNLWIKVFASEPMQNVTLNLTGSNVNATAVSNTNQKEWTVTINSIDEGSHTVTIKNSSLDLAGNSLEGFTSTANFAASLIPVHEDNGTWTNASGNDDIVHTFSVQPAEAGIPNNVTATNDLEDKVTISWISVTGASHYRIYRSQSNDPSTSTAISNWITPLTFDDTTADPAVTYYYWVKAATSSTGDNESEFSAGVTGSIFSNSVADFTFNQTGYYNEGYPVEFYDNSEGDIESWYWSFGDGYSSSSQNPTHQYYYTGTYNACLKVTNTDGIESERLCKTVDVINDLTSNLDVEIGCYLFDFYVGSTLGLTGYVNGGKPPYDYSFDLGNNQNLEIENENSPTTYSGEFTYDEAGTYNIILTVFDDNGSYGQSSMQIDILDPITINPADRPDHVEIDYLSCRSIPIGQTISFVDKSYPSATIGATEWWWDNCGCQKYKSECYTRFPGFHPVISHSYNERGIYQIKYYLWLTNLHSDYIAHYLWVNVVDCDLNIYNHNITSSFFDTYNDIDRFYAGNYNITSLSAISNYNDKKLEFTACNSIKLRSGFRTTPQNGGYIKLSVGNECLHAGNKSSNISQPNTEILDNTISATELNDEENGFIIFPNPNNGSFTLELTGEIPMNCYYEIYNPLGNKVIESSIISSKQVINLEPYAKGVYFIKVSNFNDNQIKRIIYN